MRVYAYFLVLPEQSSSFWSTTSWCKSFLEIHCIIPMSYKQQLQVFTAPRATDLEDTFYSVCYSVYWNP